MSRALVWVLIGLAVALLISLIYVGAFGAPPFWALGLLVFTILLSVGDTAARAVRTRFMERKPPYADRGDPTVTDLGGRLMGDYPPYVIEAAQEVAQRSSPQLVPLLEGAIERLILEQPAGWREMTGAMVEALGSIGDAGCLVLLYRVQKTRGAEEIENLPRVIAGLEDSAKLLRATASTDEHHLLRVAQSHSKPTDPVKLLRPDSDADEITDRPPSNPH
jgi:hypothetical protein